MMIRINLLPVRAVKKREMGRQVVGVLAFALLLAMGGNYYWFSLRQEVFDTNQNSINSTRARIGELDKVIGEVKNINTRKAEVEKKLAVLDELRRGRSGPVRMLDALASSLPKKAWIRSFMEERGTVKLNGAAVSHDDVAELMRGLNSMVWTPKGLGRLVEQRREAKTSRVELLVGEGTIEEFQVADIKPFFKDIDLKNSSAKTVTAQQGPSVLTVDFEITLTANYAI
jgi:type IV pilus assembly protein PilN